MEQIAPSVKSYNLYPAYLGGAATVSGTGQQVSPGGSPSYDAVAIVNVGAATGTPDSYTATITIEECATVGGSYTTNKALTVITAAGIAHAPIRINPAKPFLRATVVLAFVNGTSPKLPVAVDLLVRQVVAQDSNAAA